MKNGKAPGMDGVPSDAIKLILQEIPEEILKVLNGVLNNKNFQKHGRGLKLYLLTSKENQWRRARHIGPYVCWTV